MKKIDKSQEPHRLGVFRSAYPNARWEKKKDSTEKSFHCCRARYIETQHHLRADQGNLCAYCEQDLLSGTHGRLQDCRIEHFHPKSESMRLDGDPNWALEWSNLLAVCCGGSQPGVVDPDSRYDVNPSHHSCDVPKADKNLDGIILNPLKLIEENIWIVNRSSGEISVNEEVCSSYNIDIEQAFQTIKELNLNSARLKKLRKSIANDLNDLITKGLSSGKNIEESMRYVARFTFNRDSSGNLPSFFTTRRYYLKSVAEEFIKHPI